MYVYQRNMQSQQEEHKDHLPVSSSYVPFPRHYQYPVETTASFSQGDAMPIPTSFYQPWSNYSVTQHNPIELRADQFTSPGTTPESPVSSLQSSVDSETSQSPLSPLFSCTTSTPPIDTDSGNSSDLSCESSPNFQTSDASSYRTITLSSPDDVSNKKNTRTNYSPQQIRTLEKIFLEIPYPEFDVMEQLSRDLGIPEKNLKIWFQNKRARWRKRVRDNKPGFAPATPGYIAQVPGSLPQYSMMSPSALMSPVLAAPVGSRLLSYLSPPVSNAVNNPMLQGQVQFPAYINSYMYPAFR